MTTHELYCKGARVWIRDPEVVWKPGTLAANYKGGDKTISVLLELEDETEEEISLKLKSEEDLPPLRNPEILIGENDLTSLSYLHEPAVLFNLHERFIRSNAIYTYCGIVLVALNPYEQLPLYSEDVIRAYSGQDMGSMDPHIFAVAEEAFKKLARFDENQSIIVSGESGAGKTVSAKYAMRYFATVGGSSAETQVEKKVLASNPIMESIGNAKTTRNDNSSRFGKYIEISFNRQHNILGANMRTYLLEKSRVVYQAQDERNYHIFYQLCAAADQPEMAHLKLGHPDEFTYTSQGDSPTVDTIDDAKQFEETKDALNLLGIDEKTQMVIFQIMSAVLHFGNVDIRPGDRESSKIERDNENLPILCELLGIDLVQMRQWLCCRKIVTVREVLTKPLRHDTAVFSRDALAKHIYSQLFSWIVTQINKAMAPTMKQKGFIGVLDIYGFEMFDFNSFEQFCINYANEKLQQQFTQHVFKLEQEEYLKEKIEWSFIDFYDNQPCIDLIENKLGILDLLDEECMLPKGADDNWCQKLYAKHLEKKHFSKPRTSNTSFVIHHFADKVEYQSEGCVEKNRDNVNDEHIKILRGSQFEFVANLFRDADAPKIDKRKAPVRSLPAPVKGNKSFKKSVGSQFRDSLGYLMQKLNSTTPHYVRCIKPNDLKQPFTFESKRAVEQLRACGVLETIRISAAGYPSRWTYTEFFTRYRVLMQKNHINKNNIRGSSEKTLHALIPDPDKYQFGKTKIFFRAGQVAYMEKLRADKLHAACVLMQKTVRGWVQWKKYQRTRKAIILLQKYTRGFLARKLTKFLRATKAAICIQKAWRRYKARKAYLRIRNSVLTIQSYYRGLVGRRHFQEELQLQKALIIQKYFRGWNAKARYHRTRRSIILLQCCVRRMRAKKELKQLKIEARSVEHFKTLNVGMENKIVSLQQKVDLLNKQQIQHQQDQAVIINLKADLQEYDKLKHSLETNSNKVVSLEDELTKLRRELAEALKDKATLEEELAKERNAKEEAVQLLQEESSKLAGDLKERENQLKELEEDIEARIVSERETTEKRLLADIIQERAQHQKLLQDYNRLEQRHENIKEDMLALQNTSITRAKMNNLNESVTENVSGFNPEFEYNGHRPVAAPRHSRNDSNEGSESGYGTLPKSDNENIDSENEEQGDLRSGIDMGLLIKLQQKVRDLEKEKKHLQLNLDKREMDGRTKVDIMENELGNVSLEMKSLKETNDRHKRDLHDLHQSLSAGKSDDHPMKILTQQVSVLGEENEKHRQEIVRLKTNLTNSQRRWDLQLRKILEDSDTNDASTNTDKDLLMSDDELTSVHGNGDLTVAYKSLKMTNHLFSALSASQSSLKDTVEKYGDLTESHSDMIVDKLTPEPSDIQLLREKNGILEKEILAVKKNHEHEKQELKGQINELKKDNGRQQNIIGKNLKVTPEAKMNQALQEEITRMTNENMDYAEQNEYLEKQVRKLKKQLKAAHKRLTVLAAGDTSILSGVASENRDKPTQSEVPSSMDAQVKSKSRNEVMGMIEYKPEDEQRLVKAVIIDLQPKNIDDRVLPGLPAYLLFMSIRFADYINDDVKVKSLLSAVVNSVKKTVKKHFEDVEYVSFWLTNTIRLLHNLKQYSGEENFSSQNNKIQNNHCLRNFDLSEYRLVMNDLGVHIYQMLVRIIENKLQPMILPAMLESDMAGLAPTKSRSDGESRNISIDSLIKQLSTHLTTMNRHGMDPEVIRQIIKQSFYLITASTINNILLRKDMCHWSKGVQIRYNLSEMEEWLRSHRLYDRNMEHTLEPLVQVAQLLQVKKRTDDDVKLICDTCSELTTTQIVKILHLYTPDEYEKRTEVAFIRKVSAKLAGRGEMKKEAQLLIDAKHTFPVTFPYNPTSINLNEIDIPESFGLNFVKKI
ncbi:unconventional myosin-Va-like isoform X3 [Apostichopus japonicus]|uniref:unconventional myosin-Va-like isoform X3 n=1 Tax=Stichopus japonicus TaxID=307972 RepID=UPI003AB69393